MLTSRRTGVWHAGPCSLLVALLSEAGWGEGVRGEWGKGGRIPRTKGWDNTHGKLAMVIAMMARVRMVTEMAERLRVTGRNSRENGFRNDEKE